jgi:hypothetical protein
MLLSDVCGVETEKRLDQRLSNQTTKKRYAGRKRLNSQDLEHLGEVQS